MSARVPEYFGANPALRAIIDQARTAEREANRPLARRHYEAALCELRQQTHSPLAAALFRWIGRTYVDDSDLDAASNCFETARLIAYANEDALGVANALNCMAVVAVKRGRLEEAKELYRDALAGARDTDRALSAMIEQNLGTIANIQGDLRQALIHYRRALAGYRALGIRESVGPVLNNIGMLYTDLRRWRKAERTFAEALELMRALGDVRNQIMVNVNLAELRTAQGDYHLAREACDSAFELAGQVGDRRAPGEIHKHYGVIFRETGKHTLAEDHLARAADIARQNSDVLLTAEIAREQGELFRRQGRHRDTLRALNRAHQLFSELRARRDVADVDRRVAELEASFLDIVRQWGKSIEEKDRYTQGHCERVTELACRLAREVRFLDERTIIWFRMGALLHDVGKVVVPLEILNKPGALTPAEREVMARHPVAGEELLADIEFPWDIRPMVRHHHERWDGSGYPEGLAGEAIPLAARILCIADVYDALTTTRSYRAAYSPSVALEIMEAESGHTFDPALFPVFQERVAAELREADERARHLRIVA
ncbi:MAG: tetratricopeptide repeat protein [Gemmatimonadetes bacterium]|nr:tetratricopeptide repeat protein [Gemmatimonadota bacterium]